MIRQHQTLACRVLKHWHSGGCRYGVKGRNLYTSGTFTSKGWQFVFGRSLLTEENKIIKLFAALYWSSKQQFIIIVFMSLPLEVSLLKKNISCWGIINQILLFMMMMMYCLWARWVGWPCWWLWWWWIVQERDEQTDTAAADDDVLFRRELSRLTLLLMMMMFCLGERWAGWPCCCCCWWWWCIV